MKKLLFLLPLLCCACSDNNSDSFVFQEYPNDYVLNIPEGEIVVVSNVIDYQKLFTGRRRPTGVPDFSKENLLLVRGTAPNGIQKISKQFVETDAGDYRLQIDIALDWTAQIVDWNVAHLVPKSLSPDKVELDIRYHQN